MSDYTTPVSITSLSNDDMAILQSFLARNGYPPGEVDGLWGPKTRAAWLKFAADNGVNSAQMNDDLWLKVSGVTGAQDIVQGPGGDTILNQFGQDGGTGSGVDGFNAGDGVLDPDEKAEALKKYPSLAHLFEIPEIADLIAQAMQQGWGADQLSLALEGTDWFQKTSAAQRQFDQTLARDPASSARDVQQQSVILGNLFGAYGVQIEPDQLREIATDVLRNGMSEQETLRLVGNIAREQAQGDTNSFGGSLEGNLASTAQQLQAMARQYHLAYSEKDMEEWAVRIMEGRWSLDGAQATIRKQASTMFQNLASQFEQGMTVEDYFAPTKNRLAQLLDLNPNSIDLTDDRWADVTQLRQENGEVRPMTFTELGKWARSQPEWQNTQEATDRSYRVLSGMLQKFGVIR